MHSTPPMAMLITRPVLALACFMATCVLIRSSLYVADKGNVAASTCCLVAAFGVSAIGAGLALSAVFGLQTWFPG